MSDLEQSLEYLPTLPAHFTLGEIKEEQGPLSEAIEHYKLVVKNSKGELAEAAYERLVRLELSQQPASYIESACGDDGSGRVVVQVRNGTTVDVRGIRVQFRYIDSGGTERQSSQSFSGRVGPGQTASTRTGITPYPNTRCEAVVTAAQIAE